MCYALLCVVVMVEADPGMDGWRPIDQRKEGRKEGKEEGMIVIQVVVCSSSKSIVWTGAGPGPPQEAWVLLCR